jgi:hypothetical protein
MIRMALHLFGYDLRAFAAIASRGSSPWPCRYFSW